MNTLKAGWYTIVIVAVVITIILGAYLIYIVLIAGTIIALFFGLKKLISRREQWNL